MALVNRLALVGSDGLRAEGKEYAYNHTHPPPSRQDAMQVCIDSKPPGRSKRRFRSGIAIGYLPTLGLRLLGIGMHNIPES